MSLQHRYPEPDWMQFGPLQRELDLKLSRRQLMAWVREGKVKSNKSGKSRQCTRVFNVADVKKAMAAEYPNVSIPQPRPAKPAPLGAHADLKLRVQLNLSAVELIDWVNANDKLPRVTTLRGAVEAIVSYAMDQEHLDDPPIKVLGLTFV